MLLLLAHKNHKVKIVSLWCKVVLRPISFTLRLEVHILLLLFLLLESAAASLIILWAEGHGANNMNIKKMCALIICYIHLGTINPADLR